MKLKSEFPSGASFSHASSPSMRGFTQPLTPTDPATALPAWAVEGALVVVMGHAMLARERKRTQQYAKNTGSRKTGKCMVQRPWHKTCSRHYRPAVRPVEMSICNVPAIYLTGADGRHFTWHPYSMGWPDTEPECPVCFYRGDPWHHAGRCVLSLCAGRPFGTALAVC